MNKIIKMIWMVSIVIVSLSMLWFLFGITACFQRSVDLVSTVVFLIAWIPALSFVVLSFFLIKNGWVPNDIKLKILLLVGVVAISLIFTIIFFVNSTPYGWLKENVVKDYMQISPDEKYEYRIEIVNAFQRNGYVRLYMKDIVNGGESKIELNIPLRDIHVISGGEGSIYPEPEVPPVWAYMLPTDNENIYILTTTDMFNRNNIYIFQIDAKQKMAIRMTQGEGSVDT